MKPKDPWKIQKDPWKIQKMSEDYIGKDSQKSPDYEELWERECVENRVLFQLYQEVFKLMEGMNSPVVSPGFMKAYKAAKEFMNMK